MDNLMNKLPKCISGFWIKRIAVAVMIIDHVGAYIILPIFYGAQIAAATDAEAAAAMTWYYVWQVCDAVGSMGFPLFCFMIAQGFTNTSSRKKYAIRMAAFAAISEVPFNLVRNGTALYPELQNVMFTLTMGIVTLLALTAAEERVPDAKKLWTLRILITALGMGIAYAVRGEYVFLGVLAIVLFYELREHPLWRLTAFVPLAVPSFYALLALPVVLLYNGSRGRGSKYFFYVFYPAHFMAIYAAVQIFGLTME